MLTSTLFLKTVKNKIDSSFEISYELHIRVTLFLEPVKNKIDFFKISYELQIRVTLVLIPALHTKYL